MAQNIGELVAGFENDPNIKDGKVYFVSLTSEYEFKVITLYLKKWIKFFGKMFMRHEMVVVELQRKVKSLEDDQVINKRQSVLANSEIKVHFRIIKKTKISFNVKYPFNLENSF